MMVPAITNLVMRLGVSRLELVDRSLDILDQDDKHLVIASMERHCS